MSRILLVDPDGRSRRAVARLLEEGGSQVTVAHSPADAPKEVNPKDFDLLMADVGGPRPDGLELVRAFKRENPEIAFVLLTAYPTVDTAVKAGREGAIDYLRKPATAAEVYRAVALARERKRLTGEAAPGPPAPPREAAGEDFLSWQNHRVSELLLESLSKPLLPATSEEDAPARPSIESAGVKPEPTLAGDLARAHPRIEA